MKSTDQWRKQLERLQPLDLPLLAIGAGIEGKAPIDPVHGTPLKGWPDKRHSIGEIVSGHTEVTAVGTRTGADANGLLVFDIDGATALEHCLSKGCDPSGSTTWQIHRDTDPCRLKVAFMLDTQQQVEIGQLHTKITTKAAVRPAKAEAVEIFHGVGQVVVLGVHRPSKGNYLWPDGYGPEHLAPITERWWQLALTIANHKHLCSSAPVTPEHTILSQLPPRPESELLTALERVPEFFHKQGRREELLGLAQRLTVEWGRDRAYAWMMRHSPTIKDLKGYFRTPPDHIQPGWIWPFLREHYGIDITRHDLKRELRPAGPKGRFTPSPTSTAKWGKRNLSHAKAMACFDKCVQVQAARERNSLRRRARLLKAVRDLGLHQAISRQDIAQRVLEAKDQHQGNAYRGLTAADRLAMEWPEVDWLIPDLLPANDLSIIGGRPKVGKTAMAMAIAAAVLMQTRVAGFDPPQSTRPVIVISDDQGDADTKQALTQLEIFDHPQLIWSRRFRLTESDLDQMLADVRRNPGALVILDSLRSVSRALQHGENDPEIGAVIYDLKAAVMDAGGSVLLVHHCNKGPGLIGVEALSGHNAIAGAANTVITLHYVENGKGQPDKEAMQRRLVREGRTGAPLDWVISRTAGTATFHQVGTWASWQEQIEKTKREAKREASQTETKREVLGALQERQGQMLTCRQVVEAMGLDWGDGRGTGKDPARVRRALNALAKDGQIEQVRKGTEFTFGPAKALTSCSTGVNNVNSVSSTAAQSVSALTPDVSTVSTPDAPAPPADTADIECQRSDQLQLKGADTVDTADTVRVARAFASERSGYGTEVA